MCIHVFHQCRLFANVEKIPSHIACNMLFLAFVWQAYSLSRMHVIRNIFRHFQSECSNSSSSILFEIDCKFCKINGRKIAYSVSNESTNEIPLSLSLVLTDQQYIFGIVWQIYKTIKWVSCSPRHCHIHVVEISMQLTHQEHPHWCVAVWHMHNCFLFDFS